MMNASPIILIAIASLSDKLVVEASLSEMLIEKAKRAKEWLKDANKFQYDIECNWLRPDERAARVAEGRCPLVPSTTTLAPGTTRKSFLPPWLLERLHRKKKKPILSIRTKRAIMSAFSLGYNDVSP
ncbi:unnamed protein product [Strongylus vulgaris]|uniref:Uncharacterized protein n=1 Tax=Strongylus vulgaris TaxID=40348 RepID=A0A3P7I9D9_STRVU|nr:unnamed protein product [Strongylus vulgaris]